MVAVYPHASRSATDDISVVNAPIHPDRKDQTYLLRPGPIHFTALRIAVDEGLHIGRWNCSGALRTCAHLIADTLHIAFPTGTSLRLDGLPIDDEDAVVTLSLGGADCSVSTLQQIQCVEMIVSGQTLAALLGGSRELREALSAQCSDRMAVMRIGRSALALRDALRHALEAGREALAQTDPEGLTETVSQQPIDQGFDAAIWRRVILDLVRPMLEDTLASPDLLSTRAGHRRHALAREAERLIWRRIACGEAGGLSLDALCADLGTTRRTLQLAFQDHFATSVGLVTRSARLQQVRTELGSGTAPAVSEAALRSGFDHLGRFARYYRDFFGEPPSATLRGQRRRSGAA